MNVPTVGLPLYIDGLCARLGELLPRALTGRDVEAVHHSRVATRRLAAAVELYRPAIAAEVAQAAAKQLRKLRRRLGKLRDLDVMLGHLDELAKSRRLSAAIRWLRPQLEQAREQIVRSLTPRARQKQLARLEKLAEFRQAVAQAGLAVEQLVGQSLRNQLVDFSLRADAALEKEGKGGPESDPHELRIAGKVLRYTFEMAQQGGLDVPQSTFKRFKEMQDALGQWHDYAILAQSAVQKALDQELAIHDEAGFTRMLLLCQELAGQARRHFEEFRILWAKHGLELRESAGRPTAAAGTIAPQTGPHPASISGSASPVGAGGSTPPAA